MDGSPQPSTSGPSGTSHENEKRRKQTVERARANHLSRQLQMRLQYARLKVDHGWQKQNLNEVENLYFHHSHLRGTKLYTTPVVATTSAEPNTIRADATTNPPQSSLSFKFGSSSLPRSHSSTSPTPPQVPDKGGTSGTVPQPLTEGYYRSASGQTDPSPLVNPSGMNDLIHMEVDQESKRPITPTLPSSPAPRSAQLPEGKNFAPPVNAYRSDLPKTPLTPSIPWDSALRPSPSPSNYYPNVLHRHPTIQLSQTSTGDNSFQMYPSVSLTYDSFWSSHSSTTGSRSFKASVSAPVTSTGVGHFSHSTASVTSKVFDGSLEMGRRESDTR